MENKETGTKGDGAYSHLSEETGISERAINDICTLAKKYHLRKVILYGSRARGDYYRTSDIDLAISGGDKTMFALDVDEYTWTLLKYDILDLDRTVAPELRAAIEREGKVIYEKA